MSQASLVVPTPRVLRSVSEPFQLNARLPDPPLVNERPTTTPLLSAIFVAVLFLALNQWWRPLNAHANWLAFALGFFYTFHVGFTLWSLRRDQPDLKADGWLFSLVIIYMANVLVFAVLFSFIQDHSGHGVWPTLRDCSVAGWERAAKMYGDIAQVCRQMLKPV